MVTHELGARQATTPGGVQFLYEQGFNLLPIKYGTKSPDMGQLPMVWDAREEREKPSWEPWGASRQTPEELGGIDWNGGVAGISGISGIRAFDFDFGALEERNDKALKLAIAYMGLPRDYQWVVLTGSGFSLWFVVDGSMPFSGEYRDRGVISRYVGEPRHPEEYPFKQLEYRWEKCYAVLPPSTHPSGRTYEWLNGDPTTPIAVVPAAKAESVFTLLAKLKYEPSAVQQRIQEIEAARPLTGEAAGKWARAAFEGELNILRETSEGGRNDQLFKSAARLGEIIEGGHLDRDTVEEALYEVATEIGLEADEIDRTIQSGLRSGASNPRVPMERKPLDVEDDQLLRFSEDDAGNAESFMALYGDRVAYNKVYGWMVYNGRMWEQEQSGTVMKMVIQSLRRRRTAAEVSKREGIEKITSASGFHIRECMSILESLAEVPAEEFDNNTDLLNVRNGVLNLRTGELTPHNSKQKFTTCVDVEYDASTPIDEVESFLKGAVGGKGKPGDEGYEQSQQDVIDYLQGAVGYSLTGYTTEEVMFYIYGPGRSGKGTFSESMMRMIPRPLATEVDFNTFTRKREGDDQNFDLAGLKPSRMIFASESNKYQSLNPGKIKSLTGGNKVHCAFKHKGFFEYDPQYKVWLVSNHTLRADVDDDAMWARVRVIDFPISHIGSEDRTLKARMKSPAVLKQWLAWAVRGAMRWHREGLPEVEAIKIKTQEHRDAQDTVKMFLEECVVKSDETDFVENYDLMKYYKYWCNANEQNALSQVSLTTSLKAKGYSAGEPKKVNGATKRGVYGIRLEGYDREAFKFV